MNNLIYLMLDSAASALWLEEPSVEYKKGTSCELETAAANRERDAYEQWRFYVLKAQLRKIQVVGWNIFKY